MERIKLLISWLENLKNKSSFLFYLVLIVLALPIIGALVVSIISPMVRSWLASSASRLIGKTKEKDESIKKEIGQLQDKIDSFDKEIAQVDEKLKAIDSSVDENWHKNMKSKK